MGKIRTMIAVMGAVLLLSSFNGTAGLYAQTVKAKTTQTGTKAKQTKTKPSTTKPGQKSTKVAKPAASAEPTKVKDPSVIEIGTQSWAIANLNVSTFRNGDSIPEVRTNKEWVAAGDAGKPAWCYYNNDPAIGKKYGKLYNWYAVNDPRGLAPNGWAIASDADWTKLSAFLAGHGSIGTKLKSVGGWSEGDNGSNEAGFNGFPGGYRIENGLFQNIGSTGIWWSATESKTQSAFDHYLATGGNLGRSSSPKQRAESVRCIKQ
jgi:uncharacterized protein (TIGR02145 family)